MTVGSRVNARLEHLFAELKSVELVGGSLSGNCLTSQKRDLEVNSRPDR